MYRCLLLWIFVCVSACQCDYEGEDQSITVNIHVNPPSLDPRRAVDSTSINVLSMFLEGLTRTGSDDKPGSGIAKRWDISKDKRTYTFHLRDAKWHDNTEVTATDFKQAWLTVLSPTFPAENAKELYVIKNGRAFKEGKVGAQSVGIEVVDKRTLKVLLEHPTPYFLDVISTAPFLPVHPSTPCAPFVATSASELPIGNGPFVPIKYALNNEIVMEKSPTYWDAKNVKLKQITLIILTDINTELSLFKQKRLDWAGLPLSMLPVDALTQIKTQFDLQSYSVSGTYYYVFNTEAPPFDNRNVRRAFALSVDRQTIIDNILQEGQLPATSMIPPTMWKAEPHFKDHDVKLARELLKDSGAQIPAIKLSYNTQLLHHKIAQAIQEQWRRSLGAKVELENKEWKVFLDELRNGKFQVARMGGLAVYNDPTSMLDQYDAKENPQNYSNWENAEYTALLEAAAKERDEKRRMQLLRSANAILIDEMPVLPIYYYTFSYLKNPRLKGVHLSHTGHITFTHAYLEEKE